MNQDRSVVVTGLGAVTPLGADVSATWSALLAGKSGVRLLTEDWAQDLPVRIAARSAVDPADLLGPVQVRRLDRASQFAVLAAREAWADAGAPSADPVRLGVAVSSGVGGVGTLLAAYNTLASRGAGRVSPLTVPMLIPNSPAAHIGLEVRARAGVHTPVSACASGAEGVAYGVEMIRAGRADVVIAGGTEAAIDPLLIAAFAAMKAMSLRNGDPEAASRPFDTGRDGFVLGEGAAVLVLESAAHAAARGARVYCEVAGAGMTSDSHHIAQPDPDGDGVARAIDLALADGGIEIERVVHVNAHATATPKGDIAEATAVRTALGWHADQVAVSGIKSMTGHLLGGAGALESVATVLAVHHRVAPPTINVEDLDERIGLDVVRDAPRPLPAGEIVALNNSFGFGGHNVVLAFRAR